MHPLPVEIPTRVVARLPDALRGRRPPHASGGGERDSFFEGPSVDRDGTLFVTDLHNGRVLRLGEGGRFDVVCEYDGFPNGLKIHQDGRLFLACNKRGVVTVDPGGGDVTPVVSEYRGEPLRGPNDLFFASNGDLYFTDPGAADLRDPHGRVFRLRAGARAADLELLIDRCPFPNGIVMSPDESLLYVAVTRANQVWRARLLRDGSLERVGVFVQLSGGLSGPDGMAVDEAGNLAVAHYGMGTVWLVSRLGEPVARVRSAAGLGTTNVAYGGDDRRTLYVTESETGSILAARMPQPGRPMYSHR